MALERVILDRPDLVVLDIDMPEIDGLEVLKRIKDNPATKSIPVIMLTARSDSHTFERAVDYSADRYIAKPFNSSFLLEKVSQVLEEYSNQ